ncbi:ABC transporter permease [Parafrankia colletiae]|uniref:ABC transporter permease n=1 Tax=Parafrankia colletiae TaxID=573497 RepID=A0A1S1Q7H6_9ACTN|nr:ABC transporter permease [Parafrankia colletiae]MCK9904403.1 ABC transporter permease [Frankia sp. Cpl3]OHV28134.1 ABC transporter permease [Parafrankia colletiae]
MATETQQLRLGAPAAALRFTERWSMVGLWILLALVFALLEPSKFATSGTFKTIFGSQAPLLFLAMAVLCTIMVGEFVDLSVASVLGLAATLLPVLAVQHHVPIAVACLAALAAGVLVGVVNGALIVYLGVNTIVVTLGMSTLLLGLALWSTDLNSVSGLDPHVSSIALTDVFGLPISFYYGIALVLVVAYVTALTPLGRHMRFVHANREVGRLAGVQVNRIRFGAFVLAGLLSAGGGVLLVTGVGGFDPNSSGTYLLPTYAAVFIGTAVVRPGSFNPIGTWIGTYFLATGVIGLQELGLAAWISNVFYGGVLIVAVAVSTIIGRRRRG